MSLKLDTNKLIKQIKDDAAKAIMKHAREVIESVYCVEHNQFAQLTVHDQKFDANNEMPISFSVCCEDLRKRVELAMEASKI